LRFSPHFKPEPKNRPYRKKENGQEKETNRDVFSKQPRRWPNTAVKQGAKRANKAKDTAEKKQNRK
jgi:hypothetical protein